MSEKQPVKPDVWSSPAASSNPEQLLCNYQFSDMVDACKIYYAPDQFMELSAEQLSDGEILIPWIKAA